MARRMHETKIIDYVKLLNHLEIKRGDNIMLHADLRVFGRVKGGYNFIIDELLKLVGSKGTIATPSFTFSFPGKFDLSNSRSKIGGLTSLFSKQKNVQRVPDGMTSYYLLGGRSRDFIENWDNTSYGEFSILGQMVKLDGLVLQFDTDILSLVHYVEQKVNVPYRELKRFEGEVINDGKSYFSHTDFYARIRDVKKIIPDPIRSEFYAQKARPVMFNGRTVRSFRMKDYVDFATSKLTKDKMLLVE